LKISSISGSAGASYIYNEGLRTGKWNASGWMNYIYLNGQPMSTTTIPTRKLSDKRPLWSGQFHFLVSPDCELDHLRGRVGGYVSAIASADSQEIFIRDVFVELKSRQLVPDDEYEAIEEISQLYRNGGLSDKWMALCKLALNTGRVAFDTFDLYTGE
jgi:hypothetical protein